MLHWDEHSGGSLLATPVECKTDRFSPHNAGQFPQADTEVLAIQLLLVGSSLLQVRDSDPGVSLQGPN